MNGNICFIVVEVKQTFFSFIVNHVFVIIPGFVIRRQGNSLFELFEVENDESEKFNFHNYVVNEIRQRTVCSHAIDKSLN